MLFEEARLADSSVYTVKVVMAKMCIKNPQEPVILTPSILMYTVAQPNLDRHLKVPT